MKLPEVVLRNRTSGDGASQCWTTDTLYSALAENGDAATKRTVERTILSEGLLPPALEPADLRDERDRPVKSFAAELIGSFEFGEIYALSIPKALAAILAKDKPKAATSLIWP